MTASSAGELVAHLTVFILTKNEAPNIGRCLEALQGSGWDVIVLDSGSSDDTAAIVARFPFATLQAYRYVDHCTAYNAITTHLCPTPYAVVLDADMAIGTALQREIERCTRQPDCPSVLIAPIRMCVEGVPLQRASLCPPKHIVFRFGTPYFVSSGHGERLVNTATSAMLDAVLIHDDRKDLAASLQSQARYAENLVKRSRSGHVTSRDRLRLASPLLVAVVPLYSLIVRGGVLDGYAGLLYAMDRLIAEAVMFRQSIADRVARRRAVVSDPESTRVRSHEQA
jgi:glycosyltransferase involved in cell wall biosynthesis